MFLTPLLLIYVLNNSCIILNFVLDHYVDGKKIHFQLILDYTEPYFAVVFIYTAPFS